MQNQYTTFISGTEYTLSQIFAGENKIIIPDLQRDYCWGNNVRNEKGDKAEELVSGFVQNLLTAYDEHIKFDAEKQKHNYLTLGLIYGYEQPKHHIQLCDGQQRITTLYLLLGMLNRRTNNSFQNFLISDYELTQDDKEPYLQYAIRESTLYFLSDLVCEFFLKSDVEVSDIQKKNWYFTEYDLDASIQSMLAALGTIENQIKDTDCKNFGNFILNNLQMLYYDMGDRTHGEETFVVINTTGEPLTATENLKPILLGNIENEKIRKEFSEQWEECEDWFWRNKTLKSRTADGGVKDFFEWYWQIRLLQERAYKDKKPIPLSPKDLFTRQPEVTTDEEESPSVEKWKESSNLDTVHNYFKALKKLIELCKNEKITSVLKTIEDGEINLAWFRKVSKSKLHIVLPLIAYLQRFDNPSLFYEFVRRIRKNHFDKEREYRNINFIDWRHIVQIIEFSNNESEVLNYDTKANEGKFKKIPNVVLNEWYNEDEKNKDILKANYKEKVEEWEDNSDLRGDLTPLWTAAGGENNYAKMKQIWNNFEKLYLVMESEVEGIKNKSLSNWFRMYRLLEENYERVGHQSGVWGERTGARFSEKMNYYLYSEPKILHSLSNSDMVQYFQNLVRKYFEISPLKEQHILYQWLFFKTLYAESVNKLITYHDYYCGIHCYENKDLNRLNDLLPFSLGNCICGRLRAKKLFYDGKYEINPSNDTRWWEDEDKDIVALDTPIGNFITKAEWDNKDTTPISEDKINQINERIQQLLNDFYGE
jgi:hypothetical protein